MSKTLDDFQAEVGAWGDVTFPRSTAQTVTSHFAEEAGEFTEAVAANDMAAFEEAADCLLLLLHFAHKSGFSLHAAAEHKLAVNRARRWKTTPEPGGHIKHAEGNDDDA